MNFLKLSFKSYNRVQHSIRRMSSNISLNADEISRYSRQMLVKEIGKTGQIKLKSSSVLIVGCGGLGCPSALYLAAAGIGKLGLIDSDVVERSNLHRQILHRESSIGAAKTDSALQTLKALNSNVVIETYQTRLDRTNAIDIISEYDIVIDGTDNALARYLLSDACVLRGKPMVSGSALRFDGQLTVYNYDSTTPCYRCLFPNPPPAGTVTNCSDGGVIGVVPGIIGNIQALEAIKIAIGVRPSYAGQLLLFDALNGVFKTVKIRSKKEDCISCGSNATIDEELVDYEAFCGVSCDNVIIPPKILKPEERISGNDYKTQFMDTNESHLLIDVRSRLQADITKLSHAINIPLEEIANGNGIQIIEDLIDKKFEENKTNDKTGVKVFCMCRRGIASQKAVKMLKSKIKDSDIEIKDIEGGLEKWSKEVDPTFPMY